MTTPSREHYFAPPAPSGGAPQGVIFKGLSAVVRKSPIKIFLSVPTAVLTEPEWRVATGFADGGQEASKGRGNLLRGEIHGNKILIKKPNTQRYNSTVSYAVYL